jgi:putative ABC transport system substrate-binding protein
MIGRRTFFTSLIGAAITPSALPLSAEPAIPPRRIRVLSGAAESDPAGTARLAAFRQELAKLGWLEERNVRVDYRFAPGGAGREPDLAKELVSLQPDIILAGSSLPAAALQRETSAIPIVFANIADPIGAGFVRSLARPGGNLTGMTSWEPSITGKLLQMLKEIAP